MGNRSSIIIEDQGNRVHLYSHWGGESVIASALHGLSSGRVNDPEYLARIVFEHMIEGDEGSETGYGISATPVGVEHPTLVLSDKGVYFDGLTKPVSPTTFNRIVEGFDWCDLSSRDELYDDLISVLSMDGSYEEGR